MSVDCHLCHGPHDPEFHRMNARHHKMFRNDVTRYLDAGLMPAPGPRYVPKPTPKSEAANCIGHVPPSLTERPVGRPTLKWVTTAWILKRQSEGLTHPQIAKEAGCGIALIAKRLHSAISTPAWKARQLPHLGDAGTGVHRKRPHLGNAGTEVAWISDPTSGTRARAALVEYMRELADRMRRVRVCCGDWSRVCGPSPTVKLGITGVFLDPPYADEAGRQGDLYATDSGTVAHAVREWAIANGDNPDLRIALCGYEGEHVMPESWECIEWKARGGYGSQGDGKGRENSGRERIWFSPFCLRPQESLFAHLGVAL